MKKLSLLLALCLLLTSLTAMQVSNAEAQSIATNWMNQISGSKTIAAIETISNPTLNSIDLYIVNFNQGGFVLISGDDKALPIIGYDTANTFVITGLSDNIQWFIDQYQEQMSLIRTSANLTAHPDWQAVRTGNFTSYMTTRAVSPLLNTNWDQGWPYNSMCPSSSQGPGGHVYAGCGATTMGQIMKFWQHPAQGTGTHTYTHPTYGTLTADFGSTTYNFASMPNELGWTANNAISKLLYHCGISINMDYAPDGSGALSTSIRGAMIDHFGYDTSAQTVFKSAYTATNWDNLIKTELNGGRPVFYFGTDSDEGGHAFVCDGFSGTNYFHINWGWSGSENGYFYFSNLNPGMFQFNTQQGAVIGLQPATAVSAPTNLTATLDFDNSVYLQWQSPLSRSLNGYTLYRNGIAFDTITEAINTTYYDINLEAGTYQYYVVANFSQGVSQPSNTASATVYPAPVINYQDSFESYNNFLSPISPWYSYDLDSSPTRVFSNINFPSEGEPKSFIVFNPTSTTPPTSELSAFSGQKMLASIAPQTGANNDWVVSPKWNTGAIGKLRFWAKSAYPAIGLEKIKVGVSLLSPEPAGMTIISGANPVTVPGEWTLYEFTLSNYLDSCIFVGIQCVSTNGAMLLVDRFQMWTSYVENEDNTVTEPISIKLKAYPNPFNTMTNITWQQKDISPTSIRIYDVKGQLVKTLTDNQTTNGNKSIQWNGLDNNGKSVADGIYFFKMQDKAGHSISQKLIKIK